MFDGMNVNRIGTGDLGEVMHDRVSSNEWWIIVPVTPNGMEVLNLIITRFYGDTAGGEIQLALPMPVLFAKKSRLSPDQLADFMSEIGAPPALTRAVRSDSRKAKVIVLVEEGTEDLARSVSRQIAGLIDAGAKKKAAIFN